MILFQEGFDHYGDDGSGDARDRMLQGRWAEIGTASGISVPSPAGARTGTGCFYTDVSSGSTTMARAVLPSTYSEIFVAFALLKPNLPIENAKCFVLDLRDSGNNRVGAIYLQANGSLSARNSALTELGASPANTITAGVWHQIEVRWKINATTGVVQIKVDGVTVLDLSAQNTGVTNVGQLRWFYNNTTTDTTGFYIDDLFVNDTSGSYNTGFPGTVRIRTTYMRADDETGWTANRRYKFGNGILELPDNDSGVTCSDNTQFEMGSGDFTMEAFVRFLAEPGSSERSVIFGKWRESTNERSYRLFLGGSAVNGGNLEFQTSTDGTAGTVATVCSSEFSPIPDQWYHVVVQRDGGETVMFVDGVPLNAPEADASTYHDNASLFCVGAQQSGASSLEANTGVLGFLEEVRITKGVARYNTSGFTAPVAAFGRSVGTDADFASVSLLMGFDTTIADESSFGRAVTARGAAARFAVDDAPTDQFNTINQVIPRDDTSVTAPYIAATNVLTFTGQPANNDTVTVDSNVYTFKTALTPTAGEVLIGAAVNDSINNLVAAINGDAGSGTLYAAGTTASDDASALNIDNSQMRVTANTPGTAGNSITATESCANAAWADTGGTLVGGLNIPGPSSFFFNRLPAQTTGIRAITLITRAYKTDSGPAKVQASFVTADNSSANGSEKTLTTSVAYYDDNIEEDPSTTSALTPASFIGARLRIDRTE